MKQTHSPRQLLQTYLRPQMGQVALLALLVLVVISLQLLNPQILRRFLDGVENRQPLSELRNLALLFIGLAILRQLFQVASTYVGELVAWTATNALRADLALHCLRLDMDFHKVHKPGELIERVDGDVNQLAAFFSQLVIRLTANLLLCIGILVLLWSISEWLALAILGIVIGGAVVIRLINSRAIPRVQALREIEATLFGYIEEWLTGTETIRTNSAEPYIMQRLYGLLRERWQRGHHSMKMTAALNVVPNSVFSLAYIAVFTIGAWHYLDQQVSIGTLYVTFRYIDLLREPLWQLTRQIEQLQRAAASINRINELFAEQPSILDPAQPVTLKTPASGMAVTVDQLDFAYADEPDNPILRDINFTLAPGTVLGLLGRTGSGKSTLTKLLLRFYDATDGAIRLGDVDIRAFSQSDLRQQIGVVTQQVQLFNASVRDNLTLFDSSITDEKIMAALETVGLHHWLALQSEGLETRLSADGSLSAGEAQLLAFTRVFLADPKLIILDEASSRLDPATEQRIESALDKLLHNRTAIIVAHRLATVLRADEIMILSDGRIIEHDTRTRLQADPTSQFSQLLQQGLEVVSA